MFVCRRKYPVAASDKKADDHHKPSAGDDSIHTNISYVSSGIVTVRGSPILQDPGFPANSASGKMKAVTAIVPNPRSTMTTLVTLGMQD